MLWQNWWYWFFLAVKCLCTEIQVLELFAHLFPPSPPQSLHTPSAKGRRRGCPPPKHGLLWSVSKLDFRVWSTRAKHQRSWKGKNPLTENSIPPRSQIVNPATRLCSDAEPAAGPRDLTCSPPPPPGGQATRRQTRAKLGGGGVPYLGSAHPSPGRVPAPAARALAARPPPPPPCDFAGMQAAADLASISSFPIRGINRP